MITREVQLQYRPVPQRPARAVLLPGDNARVWLEEISRWPVSQADLRLFVVPKSTADRQPRGLLVTFDQGKTVPDDARGQLYGVFHNRLYLPVHAALSPEILHEDVPDLLETGTGLLLWHPHVGLIRFEQADALSVSDLIQPRPQHAADWSRALPGLACNTRLHSVRAEFPSTPESVLKQAGGDIGSLGKSGKGVPPSEESKLTPSGQAVVDATLGALGWALKRLTAGLSHFLSDAMKQALQEAASRWNARSRELERLLKMLEERPDVGLKYAIPMTGDASNSRPGSSSRLVERSPLFNLSRLGERGGGDLWEIPPNSQLELRNHYLRLAEREARLGRHLRAAYIHAELIGDLRAAAAVLAHGRHFREAAVLYRDKLKQPREAAKCLEQGGLLHEAIGLYEDLRDFAHVARLYEQLAQPTEAQAAYRAYVEQCLERSSYLEAARCCEGKLNAPDEALQILDDGWLHGHQQQECLSESLALRGRIGQHSQAQARIVQFAEDDVGADRLLYVVEVLSRTATTFPNETVREAAANTTRVLVSRALARDVPAASVLLNAVVRLCPADNLLPRDVDRFLQQKQKRKKSPPVNRHTTPPQVRVPRLEHTIRLKSPLSIVKFLSTQTGIYGLGVGNRGELAIFRADWHSVGEVASQKITLSAWNVTDAKLADQPWLCAVDESIEAIYLRAGSKMLKQARVADTQGQAMMVGTPAWLGEDVVGLAACNGIAWTVNTSLVLQAYDRNGLPIVNRQLIPTGDWQPPEGTHFIVPMHAREDAVYVALGPELVRVSRAEMTRSFHFDQEILSLAGSFNNTRARVAVFFGYGGAVLWPQSGDVFLKELLDPELECPRGVFLRDGQLLVWAQSGWNVYSTSQQKLLHRAELRGLPTDFVDFVPTPRPDRIALCSDNGQVAVYLLDPK